MNSFNQIEAILFYFAENDGAYVHVFMECVFLKTIYSNTLSLQLNVDYLLCWKVLATIFVMEIMLMCCFWMPPRPWTKYIIINDLNY